MSPLNYAVEKKQVSKLIQTVINREITKPFIKTVVQDPVRSLKLSNAFVLLRISEDLIIDFDKIEIQTIGHTERAKEKTLYLGYLRKVFESAIVIAGATDYLGAIVLFRAIFELLIGISTEQNGQMKNRIDYISFLNKEEKRTIFKLWNELSSWSHPYGKWIKNVCPRFYGMGRNYSRFIFEKCFSFADSILDFMLVIAVDHFKIPPKSFRNKYGEISKTDDFLEISNLKMFKKRITINS
jgi:hypothetical protein